MNTPMSKDRQIVLMLLRRKRLAYRLWKSGENDPYIADYLFAHYVEAANAAEAARRVLYGIET